MCLDEEEYEAYKSWYLYYKDQQGPGGDPKVPVPVDVDFDIELVRTDRINVVYILNLLKNVQKQHSTTEQREADLDLILREIERSDNESLRAKKDIMIEFIRTRFYDIPEEADIMEAAFRGVLPRIMSRRRWKTLPMTRHRLIHSPEGDHDSICFSGKYLR